MLLLTLPYIFVVSPSRIQRNDFCVRTYPEMEKKRDTAQGPETNSVRRRGSWKM
jgi:hypothetical protein